MGKRYSLGPKREEKGRKGREATSLLPLPWGPAGPTEALPEVSLWHLPLSHLLMTLPLGPRIRMLLCIGLPNKILHLNYKVSFVGRLFLRGTCSPTVSPTD